MSEVTINTSRGINLAADYVNPVDAGPYAITLVHGFLSNRHGSAQMLDFRASKIRRHSSATLSLDMSGSGRSDDEVITLEAHCADLAEASAWLKDNGKQVQGIHALDFGAAAALRARPSAVKAMVLVNLPLIPIDFEWGNIFSEQQLTQLETLGKTVIPSDEDPLRQGYLVSKQTLHDLSIHQGETMLADLQTPVMLVYDGPTIALGHAAKATELAQMLPHGSQIIELPDVDLTDITPQEFQSNQQLMEALDHSTQWLMDHMRESAASS